MIKGNVNRGHIGVSTALLLMAPPLFWAGNAVLARALVGQFPPLALSFWRWTLAFAVIAPFAATAIWRHRAVIRSHFSLLAWTGLLGIGCYNSLQYLALQTSTAVNATLIGASGPVITLLVGAAFFSSPVVRRQWVGATVSLLGVLWVIARGEPENLLRLHVAAGDLIMLAAGLAWSIYTWLLRTQRPPLPLTAFLAVQIALGALMILPFYLLEWTITRQAPAPTASNFAALVYVVLLPSLAAYYCWDRGVARVGAVLPMYFVNLTPVFAACLSWALLDDPIGIYHLAGGALILVGIYLASENRPSLQSSPDAK
ncbi:MAG TPA: DMT family transporter [Burkholderiaceae bacterium]|nr:DMT family transporter [Burkholderiaceae bacterium]